MGECPPREPAEAGYADLCRSDHVESELESRPGSSMDGKRSRVRVRVAVGCDGERRPAVPFDLEHGIEAPSPCGQDPPQLLHECEVTGPLSLPAPAPIDSADELGV